MVRKTLPNAAAICQQYFSFRRTPGESIGNFLVRETLVHEEFVEAIIRLHEDRLGVSEETRDFGLPDDEPPWEDHSWSWWGGWHEDEWDAGASGEGVRDLPPDSPDADGAEPARTEPRRDGDHPPTGAAGSSPSHRPEGGSHLGRAPSAAPEDVEVEAPDRSYHWTSSPLLTASLWRSSGAGGYYKQPALSAEEKRDILSTTKNSLDYETIAAALQSLWDEQLLGQRRSAGGSHQTMSGMTGPRPTIPVSGTTTTGMLAGGMKTHLIFKLKPVSMIPQHRLPMTMLFAKPYKQSRWQRTLLWRPLEHGPKLNELHSSFARTVASVRLPQTVVPRLFGALIVGVITSPVTARTDGIPPSAARANSGTIGRRRATTTTTSWARARASLSQRERRASGLRIRPCGRQEQGQGQAVDF